MHQRVRPLTELEVVRLVAQAVARGADPVEIETSAQVFLGKVVCPQCPKFSICPGAPVYVEFSERHADGGEDFIDLLIRHLVLPNDDPNCPINEMAEKRLGSAIRPLTEEAVFEACSWAMSSDANEEKLHDRSLLGSGDLPYVPAILGVRGRSEACGG